MAHTGLDTFDHTIQETNELLEAIEQDFGWTERRQQSYKALRVVLQAVRDRLPVEQAIHFTSQLTLLVKGIFVDGWDVSQVPIKFDRQEFLDRIDQEFTYSTQISTAQMTQRVLKQILSQVSAGQKQKILANLPEGISDLITNG